MLKNGESFIIKGKKELIFRKEADGTYVFDPYDLLTYKLNDITTEIMYLIYKNYSVEQFIAHFTDKYHVTEQDVMNTINNLIENNHFLKAILPNFITLGLL